ncbi:hypothetical protein B0H66DRAFT_46038 [Apodospora peruviana]|uniref:Tyrosine-protein phosphatase non-receptor type 6 n=1 Tax=Apodospora peruviana TaxID=516989 RepID=A0AAE0MGG7_9PEZI|nr:hypothetical protein B0H66DRAFT_46038 [Apodospora peruviana]
MHPAPNLAEAPPNSENPHPGQQHSPTSPDNGLSKGVHEQHVHQPAPASPPVRKDTTSSTSTNATAATLATLASTETTATAYSVEASPNFASQAVFSVRDGSDVVAQRRASRRRTGPLSAVQRERAALIRKLGACADCRRRRVACHPNHHNMTWEDAKRKYRSRSPDTLESAPLVPLLAAASGRPLSPATSNSKHIFTQDPQEMDIDSSPAQQPGRPPLSESRIRTPLPSGPRLDKPPSVTFLPGTDSVRLDLQGAASRILATPYRSRYDMVSVLLLHWQNDEDHNVRKEVTELANVLDQYYNYTFQIKSIPSSSDGCKSSWKWLVHAVTDFIDDHDQRDVLKIVYYNGHSYLDGNREMVLASSKHAEPASVIRWSGIKPILEEASSDVLIIMDSAYYPSSQLVRRRGVLEVIAASVSEDHAKLLDRNAFTRALTDQLRMRATQKFFNPLSAADLHAKLLSFYPKMIQDRSPEKEMVTSFPSPLHIQVSGSSKLPSILLAPVQKGSSPHTPESPTSGGTHLSLNFRMSDDNLDVDSWAEWLRSMPEGVREVKVEGPYRHTFR